MSSTLALLARMSVKNLRFSAVREKGAWYRNQQMPLSQGGMVSVPRYPATLLRIEAPISRRAEMSMVWLPAGWVYQSKNLPESYRF